jgi:hypothetical protein
VKEMFAGQVLRFEVRGSRFEIRDSRGEVPSPASISQSCDRPTVERKSRVTERRDSPRTRTTGVQVYVKAAVPLTRVEHGNVAHFHCTHGNEIEAPAWAPGSEGTN